MHTPKNKKKGKANSSQSRDPFDILDIDNKIHAFFQKEQEKLPKLKEKLFELKQSLKNKTLTFRAKSELEKNIIKTQTDIERIENDLDHNFYIAETMEILESYKEILKTPLKMSFLGCCPKRGEKGQKGQKNENIHKEEMSPEKKKIVEKYLKIARKYYNIDYKIKERKFSVQCNNCENKDDFITEENTYICVLCGSQQDLIQASSQYKDSDRINVSSKYTYDRKVHFKDCINQYQGKQNCNIDQKVYADLEDILDKHHLLGKGKERFAKITREHILMFLKELGYTKQYENVILIHYNLTGKKPDDISYLEDKLLEDFDLLIETYDRLVKNKVKRINFISTQYVLYQLLQKYKHPCIKEDFVVLKTTERKNFHDSICATLFEALGWSFVRSY